MGIQLIPQMEFPHTNYALRIMNYEWCIMNYFVNFTDLQPSKASDPTFTFSFEFLIQCFKLY